MYRIRLHGRGGQGIQTGARVLGSAFFAQGFEVQDAPRYGAERRGAPLFATVRASRVPVRERGAVARADHDQVGDATLLGVRAAGVLDGVDERTWLLIASDLDGATWTRRLGRGGRVATFPMERDAAIQRFEHSFETTWKAAQRYLQVVDGVVVASPKAAIESYVRAVREKSFPAPEHCF